MADRAPEMNGLSNMQPDLTSSAIQDDSQNKKADVGPTPNRGSSVPDTIALGPESQSQDQWRHAMGIDKFNQVKIVKLSHMRYQHEDFDQIYTFLLDFGLQVVRKTDTECWLRGYGHDHYVYYVRKGPSEYLGGAFEVESYEELEKIPKLPDATIVSKGIEKMASAPGGGSIITIRDPEGFLVNFIYGQTPATLLEQPEKLLVNDESEKPRKRKFQRFEPGPAAIHKLGHFGLCVKDFDAALRWYTKHFNIIPSDMLYVDSDSGPRKTVAMFGHIDRGASHVDHHSMFLSTLAKDSSIPYPHVHHASFEIHDTDTQFLGHQWLEKKGYKSVWGVGRHILGSQIFDYWWDTSGFMIEHYADGDLVNEETPVGYLAAGDESLAVWGPEVPSAFLD